MSEDTNYGANTSHEFNCSCVAIKPYGNGSQSAALRPAASVSPENLLELQTLGLLQGLLDLW